MKRISAKFLIGFFLIFLVSFLVLNATVKEAIFTSNQERITSELADLKNNSSVYVRQAFLINHFANNELYFGQMAQEMAADLKHATGSVVGVYTVEGKLLHATEQSKFVGAAGSDLQKAIEGETAYTISYDSNQASVLFSYPVVIEGTKVGILRFAKDFSPLYAQTGRILDIVFYAAILIFAVAFLFSYALSRHITIPLVRLTRASNEVKNGNLNVRLEIKRKDEIGRLADNFNDMIAQIDRQIGTIRKDRDRLETLNRQEKEFFDNVTHELKTPLTSILGYAELIRLKETEDRAFFEKGMNHIVEESKRLHGMVIKLLEVARQNPAEAELESVQVGAILRDVCESMTMRTQRYRKSIVWEIDETLQAVGQGDRLRQLFINLIDNAIKYALPGSEISVKATAAAAGDKIRLEFANSSEPIEPDRIEALFRPFRGNGGSSREDGSVGLGLSIAKSIVEDHRGSILMTHSEGRTVVTVELDRDRVQQGGEQA